MCTQAHAYTHAQANFRNTGAGTIYMHVPQTLVSTHVHVKACANALVKARVQACVQT